MHKLVQLSEALQDAFPFASCPHDHGCAWERLDVKGMPLHNPVPIDQEWWFRIRPTTPEQPVAMPETD